MLNIFPLVAEVVLQNYFSYQLPGNVYIPNVMAFPVLIISNFLLLVYIHYLFFNNHLSVDQQKDVLKNELEHALRI